MHNNPMGPTGAATARPMPKDFQKNHTSIILNALTAEDAEGAEENKNEEKQAGIEGRRCHSRTSAANFHSGKSSADAPF